MSATRGLKNIIQYTDKPKYESTGLKTNWLKLADGQSVKIRFVEELDEDSANFNKERGLSVVFAEHTNPKDFKRKAECTMDTEGRCFACEMARKEPKKGWAQKKRWYGNVLVDDGMSSPYIAVWSMGTSDKSPTWQTILEHVGETGSISNIEWKLKRSGQGLETTYLLLNAKVDAEPFKWSGLEFTNLDKVIREVPYAEQESFYFGFDTPSITSSNTDW